MVRVKHYLYGTVTRGDRLTPFSVKFETGAPKDALVVREIYGTIHDAQAAAQRLVRDGVGGDEKSDSVRPPPDEDDEPEVVKGSVCRFFDGHTHFAIVLRVGTAEHEALFLTSSDHWTKARRATPEELALCGFVSRTTTYLGLVRRFAGGFYATGVVFPEHRIDALVREFL